MNNTQKEFEAKLCIMTNDQLVKEYSEQEDFKEALLLAYSQGAGGQMTLEGYAVTLLREYREWLRRCRGCMLHGHDFNSEAEQNQNSGSETHTCVNCGYSTTITTY